MKKDGPVGVRKGRKDSGFSYGGAKHGGASSHDGIKRSHKGIDFSMNGRHLSETEHHERMGHTHGEHPANPSGHEEIYE